MLEQLSCNYSFGGWQKVFSHVSKVLGCKMNFAVYLPPQCENEKVPVLYWLSGLTCNETNFIQKAGAQRYASEYGMAIVCPDTSPRGLNLPKENESWDFGTGAGFYLDATEAPWKNNYKMFSYVTQELTALVCELFPVLCDRQGIFGHSMGGHGALVCALKCPGLYKSVSAFAPISNPSNCPWGQKAFSGYLGPRETGRWNEWDATELVKVYNGPPLEFFIDQGLKDEFLAGKQLLPENFIQACKNNNMVACLMQSRENYDHSYYYIATFIQEHMDHHAKFLKTN